MDGEKTIHPGSENLRPAQKGEVRNPNGRPKGSKNRQTIFRELLESNAFKTITKMQKQALVEDAEYEPKTVADQVAMALLIKAAGGDVAAIRELMDSAHGKITEKVENKHTFTKMGRIIAQPINGADGAPAEAAPVALTFDVGSEPGSVSENDEEADDESA